MSEAFSPQPELPAQSELEPVKSWEDLKPLLGDRLETSLGISWEEFLDIGDTGAMGGVLAQLEEFDELEQELIDSGLLAEFYE